MWGTEQLWGTEATPEQQSSPTSSKTRTRWDPGSDVSIPPAPAPTPAPETRKQNAASRTAVADDIAEQEAEAKTPDKVTLQWLSEPLRRDIPAQVHVSQARLGFEQRLMMSVRVEVPAKELQATSAHRDLYLAVKANDGTKWVKGGSYTHYELKEKVDKRNVIEFSCTLYVSPGHWLIGVVLYDDVTKQRTVLKTDVEVSPLKHDPLPRLEAGERSVEFLRGENPDDAEESGPSRFAQQVIRGGPGGPLPGGFGRGRNRFPAAEMQRAISHPDDDTTDTPRDIDIHPQRPIEVDLLVNFTPSVQYSGSNSMLRRTEFTFWAVTHVLTELRSPNLCMRVTGIDVLGQHVLFEHMNGANMDWDEVGEALKKLDANTVDVQSLESRTKAAAFFREQVENLLGTKDTGCAAKAEHVFVIAAAGILFPSGTASKPIEGPSTSLRTGSPTRLFYLRANLLWNDQWDAMEKIVRPLKPRTLSINDPMQFRKALAKMVSELEGPAASN